MEPIHIYSQMMIDLGSRARLLVTECTDGWNIEIVNPENVRIGIANEYGIQFKYVTDLVSRPEANRPE
jgi:hypothetical protein